MLAMRPYQTDAIAAIDAGWNEYRRQLVAMPTGCGKTPVLAKVCEVEVLRGGRCMVIAHREELISQARDKIALFTGLDTGLEMGASIGHGLLQLPVTVASVQSLHSRRLAAHWEPASINLIVIDEAHHVLADSYRAVLDHFYGARVLGVTATPDRGDKKSLGAVFESIAYEYSLRQAIADGYLAPIKAQLIPLDIDLRSVRVVAGDYDTNDLDTAITPYLSAVADELVAHVGGRKTLVFLPLIRTSQLFASILQSRGLAARHIDGGSEDRADVLAAYARGDFQVLCNSALLLEGYDCPDISCVVCLRPTKSRALYCQCIGRGTRIAPGKTDLLILDFLWQTTKHNLCVPASLFAKSEADAKQTMDVIAAGGGQMDLIEADATATHEREESLRKQLEAQKRKNKRVIDPLEFALSLHDADLEEYEDVMPWQRQEASEKQVQVLTNFGFDVTRVKSRGHASALIDRVFARRKAGLCSPKQAKLLARFGYQSNDMTAATAKQLIDVLAANGWRRPSERVA